MNKRISRILLTVFCVSLIVVLCFFYSSRGRVEADSGYHVVMGTFARIVVVAEGSRTAKKCIEAGLAEIARVDELMSDYKSDSEISEVNRDGFMRAVKVSEPTFEVLQKSLEFSRLSDGAFDITIGPLVDLWRSAAEANSPPTEDELQQAQSRVGCEKLLLDANEMSVRFAVEGMRLDLGGIAKGYAVDKAVEAMQNAGAIGAMVDVGGDIRCFGKASEGKEHWLIGLQDPNENFEFRDSNFEFPVGAGAPLLVLKLKDAAVATSGGYRRFVVIGGKRYSHIIDRRIGAGAEGLSSVTIIAKSAIDADALATAVSVLGAEKGLALIETLPQTEAILITAHNEVDKTTGLEKYIK